MKRIFSAIRYVVFIYSKFKTKLASYISAHESNMELQNIFYK